MNTVDGWMGGGVDESMDILNYQNVAAPYERQTRVMIPSSWTLVIWILVLDLLLTCCPSLGLRHIKRNYVRPHILKHNQQNSSPSAYIRNNGSFYMCACVCTL
jgi:hypothetical protein